MSAWLQPPPPRWQPMTTSQLDRVVAVERSAYSFPWTRGNFVDSLAAGYLAELMLDGSGSELLGYFVAMAGVGEMHLLNLTVAPPWQRQGHGQALLDTLLQHCRQLGLPTLWLEVRAGNLRARKLYAQRGFDEVGLRRGYYPAAFSAREDAVVMSLRIAGVRDGVE